MPLHITTYNIHKGFSQFNRRVMVHELREKLQSLGPDIVFLQEVQGLHLGHSRRRPEWPQAAQHTFLAEGVWPDTAYGENMVYDHGHHGNAILSRYPILESFNKDVTHLKFERRGLLHCHISLPENHTLHCVCVHLSLFGHSRKWQMNSLINYLEHNVPSEAPLIIAGDFNDWRNHADSQLAQHLKLIEVFGQRPVRSFPATLPLFRLDRIYVRGLKVMDTQVHFALPWSKISDHAALSAYLLCDV
ncbi:MAG: endonuclease/exonuclease/phosphatase family protein [Azovibrio sp.]